MEVYQFIKQIGQGRYGDVWLVKGSKTRKNFVLKRIDLHHISKREQRAAHSEAKLLSTIKHPNIVTYLDSFYNSKGSLFIVMNYCEHGNLHDFIKNRNGEYFEEEEIINLCVQICMALKYLHDQSILHRDVKTQNIFLTKQGLIKVGDFGIARIFNAVEKMSAIFISSPCYTSPEVFFGEPFSPKSDVWSVGCCFYEIATLKYAFSAQDISISMWPVIQARVFKIPTIYSSDFIQVTLSMLNLESDKRPTITELLLNDYIRKHILHFIRDTSDRSQSSQSGSCKVRYVSNSEINPETYSSVYSNGTKCTNVKGKIREGMFKTIPDINGNGDGNDNSQQQAFSCDKNSPNKIKPHTYFDTSKNVLNSHDEPLKTNSHTIKENHNSDRKNFLLNGSHVTNERRMQIFAQKFKSENSFKLLNTLTSTMNVTRFKSLDSFCDGNILFPSLPKSNCKYENPPKSAEDLLLLSQKTNVVLLKRPATSGEISFGAMSNFQKDSKLPLISENASGTASMLKKSCIANLPPLCNSEFLLCGNTDEERNEKLPNLEDSITDKFLIYNIMQCNKIIQSNAVNNGVISHKQNPRFSEVLSPPISEKEASCQVYNGSNS